MKRLSKKMLALLLAVLMTVTCFAFPNGVFAMVNSNSKAENYVEGEVIVVLEDAAGQRFLQPKNAASTYGRSIQLKETFSFKRRNKRSFNITVVKSKTLSTKQLMKQVAKIEGVKSVMPNVKLHKAALTDDTYNKYQWALDNTGQFSGTVNADVNAEGLWEKAAQANKDAVVALADTGLDLENPEFEGIVWNNPYGNRLLGEHGYDFSDENDDGVPRDGDGHGTHCAGIIAAAANNAAGIAGINQSKVKIMPVKWLDDEGSGSLDDAISAMEYISRAIDLGTNVVAVNNSWGGMGDKATQEMFDAIFDTLGEKGCASILAAGNECADLEHLVEDDDIMSLFFDDIMIIPASSASQYTLTVAATNEKDELAAFSNYSNKLVDVAAPGCDILSTVSYNCFNPGIYSDEKRAELVEKWQDFNGDFSEGDFGYPTLESDGEDSSVLTNATISRSDRDFGAGGKSLLITSQETPDEDDDSDEQAGYIISIPYTLPEKGKSYSVSFMATTDKNSMVIAADMPANAKLEDLVSVLFEGSVMFNGNEVANYWHHFTMDFNYKDEDGHILHKPYKESKNRKLMIFFGAGAKGAHLFIDDLAITKQDVDDSEFEKYDYYCGTSMATPYVTGAVALLKNAYPDAALIDVLNMAKNSGRSVEGLKDKVQSGKVLSLETPEKVPPMIVSAGYNSKGKVELKGSFKNITKVAVNGTTVKPVSSNAHKIVLNDNNYNTRKTTFTVTNAEGEDSASLLLSRRTPLPAGMTVLGCPSFVNGGEMLPAGDAAYYISSNGMVGKVEYNKEMMLYFYDEGEVPQINVQELFPDAAPDTGITINSATYLNGKLFFVAVLPVNTSSGDTIGYENAFGSLNLNTMETKKLCTVPDDSIGGASLAAYNGSIYLIGGHNGTAFLNTVYKFNAKTKKLVKQSAKLPQGRAYTKFIQYKNKLVGVYGAQQDGKMPRIITFDGKKWSTSKKGFDSEDFYELYVLNNKTIHVYLGNLGYGADGVFCNGAYVYGRGDTFTYSADKDTITNNKYGVKNRLDDTGVIGTTLPGCFIAFPISEVAGMDDDDAEDWRLGVRAHTRGDTDNGYVDTVTPFDKELPPSAYLLNMSTAYPKVTVSGKAKVTGTRNRVYGNKATVTVKPNDGYVVTAIKQGKTVLSKNKNTASVLLKAQTTKLTVETKNVKPSQVTGLKAKPNKKGTKATLRWKKATPATGYQIQQYVKGKWKTVKTVKKADTVKASVSLKKGKKFRVRAVNTYKGKTYYGAWSKAVKAE